MDSVMDALFELSGLLETFYWIFAIVVALGGGYLIEKRRNRKFNRKAL